MAFVKRPAYVNRQKEQQRLSRAADARDARRARKHSTGTEIEEADAPDPASLEPESGDAGGD